MTKKELDLQMMSLADLKVMMEITKDMAEHYESKGHKKEAERWKYRYGLCFNTLEYRLQRYFEDED